MRSGSTRESSTPPRHARSNSTRTRTEPVTGTLYDLDAAPWGEPGVGKVLVAPGHDGWIIAIAAIPESTPAMMRLAIDEMFDGITIGVAIES